MSIKKNALLIFGGNSFEHDISIITALIICNRAYNNKYNILPIYITKNNEWFFYSKDKMNLDMFKNFETNYKNNGFKKAYLKIGENFLYFKHGCFNKKIEVSCALNCCHGGVGENGELTAILEKCNIPISSGTALGMGICMDKVVSKDVFKSNKIPTIKSFSFTKEEYLNNKDEILYKLNKLDFPVILKPSTLGSSIGIEVVKNIDDFDKQVLVAFEFDNTILVEKAILDNMKECNVACLKVNNNILVSKIDMPIRKDEILSFNDKYVLDNKKSSKTSHIFNAGKTQKNGLHQSLKGGQYLEDKKIVSNLPANVEKQIIDISKKIYKKLMLFGPVRIDFILDKKNKVYLNEINTVPGSLAYYFFVPTIYKTIGEYVKSILDNSIIEFNKKNKIKKEYITKLI